jgi:lysozyme family protein
MSSVVFFDDVDVALLPQADYYAGYADGIYANIAAIHARFPSAGILSIAVKATDTADALDVESGDAVNSEVVPWFKLALSKGVTKPCIYTSASNVNDIVALFNASGIPRTSYRVWSAHYGLGSHICGPTTCKATKFACDATQFTDNAQGRSLDESVALSTFFTAVTPPAPVSYPTLSSGDKGTSVKTLQERLNAWHAHPAVTVDGTFGPATLVAVKAFQAAHKLTVDGVAGPATWTALNKTPSSTAFGAPEKLAIGKRFYASWEAPGDVDGKAPTGYLVELTKSGTEVLKNTVTVPEAVFEDLSGEYEITVTAQGGPSSPLGARLAFTA